MLPRSRSVALVATLVMGWGVLGVVDAAAAPPRNDDFRYAKVIGPLPFEHRTDTREATNDSTDPTCLSRKRTVWYSLTATQSGWIAGTTAGSDYDTTLSVYTGTSRDFTRIRCNDDYLSRETSLVLFEATVGQTYHFMVSSYFGEGDGSRLTFSVTNSGPPCLHRAPTIVGTPENDLIEGTRRDDVIVGLEGNDTIVGNGGVDVVCGKEGNDIVDGVESARGGEGNDTLIGGFGQDDLTGGLGDDVMRGNEGSDLLRDSQGSNEFYGGTRGDTVLPGRGPALIFGGGGRDRLSYESSNIIRGVAVDLTAGTVLVEGASAQTVDGVEIFIGSDDSDTFMGSEGDDIFRGQGGSDTIVGSFGDDELYGGEFGSDLISGSEGDDYIEGSDSGDHLAGGAGNDQIEGSLGGDYLDGGEGIDGLNGGGGFYSDSCLDGERIVNCNMVLRVNSSAELEELSPTPRTYVEGAASDFITFTGELDSGAESVTAALVAVDVQIPPGPEANSSTSGCESADFTSFPTGSVALIQRGTCPYIQKAENAQLAGATGLVLFNEGQPGRTSVPPNIPVGPDGISIPGVATSFSVGEQLFNETQSANTTVRVGTDVIRVR